MQLNAVEPPTSTNEGPLEISCLLLRFKFSTKKTKMFEERVDVNGDREQLDADWPFDE